MKPNRQSLLLLSNITLIAVGVIFIAEARSQKAAPNDATKQRLFSDAAEFKKAWKRIKDYVTTEQTATPKTPKFRELLELKRDALRIQLHHIEQKVEAGVAVEGNQTVAVSKALTDVEVALASTKAERLNALRRHRHAAARHAETTRQRLEFTATGSDFAAASAALIDARMALAKVEAEE